MKNLLTDVLSIEDLNKLVEKGKALYFNYLGNLNKFSKISEEHVLKVLKGKSNVLVDTNLYAKHGNFDYKLQIKDWLETEEAEKYSPLLVKIFYKENFPRFISNHLN